MCDSCKYKITINLDQDRHVIWEQVELVLNQLIDQGFLVLRQLGHGRVFLMYWDVSAYTFFILNVTDSGRFPRSFFIMNFISHDKNECYQNQPIFLL